MFKLKAECNFNIFGKIYGNKSLLLDKDGLKIKTNKKELKTISLKKPSSFANFKSGIFGSTIKIIIENEYVKISFLKDEQVQEITDKINYFIIEEMESYLLNYVNDFNEYVINSYPRDSNIEIIKNICEKLHKKYESQKELYEKYLSKKTLEDIKKISSFYPIKKEEIREYHEKTKLIEREVFLNNVESNPLTLEQRLGVLRYNDLNLVLAAAGTGKTSVIVAKALDIIDRKLAHPSEILILAYNKTAALEIEERLKEKASKINLDLNKGVAVSTFHAYGRDVLKKSGISTKISIFSEDEIKFKQWITNWITENFISNKSKILSFINLFQDPVNPFDFNSKRDYEVYIRDNEFRTLNNERVKGYQELLIANFLAINGVDYTYEADYVTKRRIEVGFDYRPDFKINETDIYIEHFGIDRDGNTRKDIDKKEYNEKIEQKRILHNEHGTKLIETYHYEWIEKTLESNLTEKLFSHGIKIKEIELEDLLQKLNNTGLIAFWSDLLMKALQAIRIETLSKSDILERLKNGKIKNAKEIADMLDSLHLAYVNELKNQNSIDFDDMIIRANEITKQENYNSGLKYILVDEFQDISGARMSLLKSLLNKKNPPSLTAVGDDWQAIYRFSGGKLELTTRFNELVGHHSITMLQKTFRYNNSIADTAGTFIMQNPEQYKKQIETHNKVETPQVYLLDDKNNKQDGIFDRIKEVIAKIRKHDLNASISIIARYNYLLDSAKIILSEDRLDDNVNFWTFHKSKGLEADYCILIGFFSGKNGFPNENRDDKVIEALLPSLDSFPHSEERRLMYVGLTRSKKKTYIIANAKTTSAFITELLSPKYNINIASESFIEKNRKKFKCPHCKEGYLKLTKGKYGIFYKCNSGLGCDVRKSRVCEKCESPSIDNRTESTCKNEACNHAIKICDKCGRPMKIRKGAFGEFWGCTGYGIKNDQCKNTRKKA